MQMEMGGTSVSPTVLSLTIALLPFPGVAMLHSGFFFLNYIFGELILLRKSNSQPPGWLSGGLAARGMLSSKAHKSMDNAIESGHKKEDCYLILSLTSKPSHLLCSCSRLLGSFYMCQ